MSTNDLDLALRNLRHLYEQMVSDLVIDARSAARGLLGPAIERIERHVVRAPATEADTAPIKVPRTPTVELCRDRLEMDNVVSFCGLLDDGHEDHACLATGRTWRNVAVLAETEG